MVFEQAWSIVKDVDFRIPTPAKPATKYTEPNAVLAFHGSKTPLSRIPQDTMDEWQSEVGDFGVGMHEGEEARGFLTRHQGIEEVMNELERASLVRAFMEAGIVGERELEDALDEVSFANSRGEYHEYNPQREEQLAQLGFPTFPERSFATKRLDSGKGSITTRLGGRDL